MTRMKNILGLGLGRAPRFAMSFGVCIVLLLFGGCRSTQFASTYMGTSYLVRQMLGSVIYFNIYYISLTFMYRRHYRDCVDSSRPGVCVTSWATSDIWALHRIPCNYLSVPGISAYSFISRTLIYWCIHDVDACFGSSSQAAIGPMSIPVRCCNRGAIAMPCQYYWSSF